MRIVVSSEFNAFLAHSRIFTARGRSRWKPGQIILVHDDAEIEPYSHIMEGAHVPRRLGAFSYSQSYLDPCLSIGRYCSIAPGVAPMGSQHPLEWVSTSPFSYNARPLDGFAAYFADRGQPPPEMLPFDAGMANITIGHDVWIGGQVMIRRGVTIGDGAALAARCVVTRDVPPYAVMGGVPARVLRYRFPEPVIERLSASRWWDYGPDVIQSLDVREPASLPDQLGEAIAAGARPFAPKPVTARDMAQVVEPDVA